MALAVKLCSRAMRPTSVAGTGSPASAACRNFIASALAVRRSGAVSVMDIYSFPCIDELGRGTTRRKQSGPRNWSFIVSSCLHISWPSCIRYEPETYTSQPSGVNLGTFTCGRARARVGPELGGNAARNRSRVSGLAVVARHDLGYQPIRARQIIIKGRRTIGVPPLDPPRQFMHDRGGQIVKRNPHFRTGRPRKVVPADAVAQLIRKLRIDSIGIKGSPIGRAHLGSGGIDSLGSFLADCQKCFDLFLGFRHGSAPLCFRRPAGAVTF